MVLITGYHNKKVTHQKECLERLFLLRPHQYILKILLHLPEMKKNRMFYLLLGILPQTIFIIETHLRCTLYIEVITRLREDMDYIYYLDISIYYMDILNVVDKNICANNKFLSTF